MSEGSFMKQFCRGGGGGGSLQRVLTLITKDGFIILAVETRDSKLSGKAQIENVFALP